MKGSVDPPPAVIETEPGGDLAKKSLLIFFRKVSEHARIRLDRRTGDMSDKWNQLRFQFREQLLDERCGQARIVEINMVVIGGTVVETEERGFLPRQVEIALEVGAEKGEI